MTIKVIKISLISIISFILFFILLNTFYWKEITSNLKKIYLFEKTLIFYSNKDSPFKTYFNQNLERIRYDFLNLLNKNINDLDEMNIDIKSSDLRKINNIINNIKKRDGTLRSIDKNWFSSKIEFNGNNFNTKIRIRGDQATHWENEKKSWKIKFESNNFNQVKNIDFIIPRDRMIEVNHAALKIAKKNNLIVPKNGFALLKINNRDHGLYYWEESISKNMLERNNRPESQIIKGSDTFFDIENIELFNKYNNLSNINNINQNIGFINSSYSLSISKIPEYKNIIATSKWSGFLELLNSKNEHLINQEISKYLNIEQFSKWFSILLILGSDHSQSHDNLIWYLDPLSGLFEPILRDVLITEIDAEKITENIYNPIIQSILLSKKIQIENNNTLFKMLKKEKEILNDFKESYNLIKRNIYTGIDPVNKNLDSIGSMNNKDVFYSHNNRLDIIKNNIDNLKKWLKFNRIFFDNSFLANDRNNNSILNIEIKNQNNQPLKIETISIIPINDFISNNLIFKIFIKNNEGTRIEINNYKFILEKKLLSIQFDDLIIPINHKMKLNEKAVISSINPYLIISDNRNNISNYTLSIEFKNLKPQFNATPYKVNFKIKKLYENTLLEDNYIRSSLISQIIDDKTNIISDKKIVEENNFNLKKTLNNAEKILKKNNISYELIGNKYIIKEGAYILNDSLILKNNYNLEIEKGTTIKLASNVNIILKGQINLLGTLKKPINIINKTKNINWGIIAASEAKKTSTIRHTYFSNGGSKRVVVANGIEYTGMVNFFNTKINISDSFFINSYAEDALNVKKSDITLKNSHFSYSKSDALDLDWVNGIIENCFFNNISNDGIDLSGSEININNSKFENIQDKAISVGEQSKVNIDKIIIQNSNYGVVAKDLSIVRLTNSELNSNIIAIAAYRKKPLFGGGSISIMNTKFKDNQNQYSLDSYSKIYIDNKALIFNEKK